MVELRLADADPHQKWLEQVDKGTGEIYLAIEDDQKHHLGGVLDDPKKMWELLQQGNQSKKPWMHFNTHNDLLSTNKKMKDLRD